MCENQTIHGRVPGAFPGAGAWVLVVTGAGTDPLRSLDLDILLITSTPSLTSPSLYLLLWRHGRGALHVSKTLL